MKMWAAICFAALTLTGCGYHVVGANSALPKGIQTIAVPAFTSRADQYNLSDQFAAAVAHEFTTRTHYRIVGVHDDPDAILSGSIGTITTFPTVSDPTTGRATDVGISVSLSITLKERTTGKVLYSHQNFAVRDAYEIASDPHQTFVESGPAFQRISESVARDVVASILDNF